MKKVVRWFSKKTKISANAEDLDSDALPEPPRNIPRYVPKQNNLYKTFEAHDSGSSNHKTGCDNNDNIEPEIREGTIVNGNDGNLSKVNSQPLHISHEVVEIERPSLPGDLIEEIPRFPVVASGNHESQGISEVDTLSVDSSVNLSRAGSTNNMEVQEANSAHELPNDSLPKKYFGDRKNGGNTYVITITKSTNFHIGTQKTINYPGAEDNTVHKKALQYANVNSTKLLALNGNQILDIKDRLSEDDLVQISLSIRDKWQEFARNLGLDESTIEELEDLNGNDYISIVYDILKQYLSRYPDTTVGFMVNVLRKSNEIEAIRKLTEKR